MLLFLMIPLALVAVVVAVVPVLVMSVVHHREVRAEFAPAEVDPVPTVTAMCDVDPAPVLTRAA